MFRQVQFSPTDLPKNSLWGIAGASFFCRPDVLLVTHPTVSKHSLSLSVLMATFPGKSGLAGFTGAMIEVVVTFGTIRHAKLQSNLHHR